MRNAIYILGIVLLALTSCRKKIIHEQTDTSTGEWQNYGGIFEPSTKMCVYNGELYVGSSYLPSSLQRESLRKLTVDGTLQDVTPGTFFDNSAPINIHDMLVFNNKLYVCGDFLYTDGSTTAVDLFHYNGSVLTPIPFSSSSQPNAINDLFEYGNELLIGGSFSTVGNPDMVTNGTDKLVNDVAVGLADRPVCTQFAVVQNALYAVGSSSQKVTRLDGNSWTTIQYPGSFSGVQNVQQCVSFNDELYIAGNMNNIYLKKYAPNAGVWTDFPTSQFSGTCNGFEIIDDVLYAFGENLSVSGTSGPYASVLRFNGTIWERMGNLQLKVTDLIKYDGKLLVATPKGVYAFDL